MTEIREVSTDPLHRSPGAPSVQTRTGDAEQPQQQGLNPFSMTEGGSSYYFHTDLVGSTTAISKGGTGAVEWTYSYDPYGNARSTTKVDSSAPDNISQYTGQLLDPDTGLYDLRARVYDSTTGTFISTDPMPLPATQPAVSLYVYGNDEPLLFSDPSGETAICDNDGNCRTVNDHQAVIVSGVSDVTQFATTPSEASAANMQGAEVTEAALGSDLNSNDELAIQNGVLQQASPDTSAPYRKKVDPWNTRVPVAIWRKAQSLKGLDLQKLLVKYDHLTPADVKLIQIESSFDPTSTNPRYSSCASHVCGLGQVDAPSRQAIVSGEMQNHGGRSESFAYKLYGKEVDPNTRDPFLQVWLMRAYLRNCGFSAKHALAMEPKGGYGCSN